VQVHDTEPSDPDADFFESAYGAGLTIFRVGKSGNCFALDLESQPTILKDCEFGYSYFIPVHSVETDEVFGMKRDEYLEIYKAASLGLFRKLNIYCFYDILIVYFSKSQSADISVLFSFNLSQ